MRAQPGAFLDTAHAITSAGGVMSILDPTDAGGITITKSLTIRAEGVDGGSTVVIPCAFIFINAGTSDVVTLKGFTTTARAFGSIPEGNCTSSGASSPTLPKRCWSIRHLVQPTLAAS